MLRRTFWLAALAACSSSPSAGAPDRATLACAQTIDAACGTAASSCVRKWADLPRCGRMLGTRPCGAYMAFVTSGVDTSSTSYYDASGSLVAIVDFGLVRAGCVAGPSPFVEPSCGELTPLPACADAGP